jgi:hypothetical protein
MLCLVRAQRVDGQELGSFGAVALDWIMAKGAEI